VPTGQLKDGVVYIHWPVASKRVYPVLHHVQNVELFLQVEQGDVQL
jgi:hypothetical protein